MGKTLSLLAAGMSLFGPIRAGAEPRTPEEVYREIRSIPIPKFDRTRWQEPGYLAEHRRQLHERFRKNLPLFLELCQNYPRDPLMPQWMERRWSLLGWAQDPESVADEVLADVAKVAATNQNRHVARDAAFYRAYYTLIKQKNNSEKAVSAVEEFLNAYPDDDRGASLLFDVAQTDEFDSAVRLAACRRLSEKYPESRLARFAPGLRHRIESIGKPFALSFTDVLTGKPVSTEALQGKVVVVMFWTSTYNWATLDLYDLNKLYADSHARGVELIGVNLDKPREVGGEAGVRDFVTQCDVSWPQYFQGNGYDSEFSKSWGVGGVSATFILDKKGRLRYTNPGLRLEQRVFELLAE